MIIHRVSCYVPGTDLLHASYDVSPAILGDARKIIGPDTDDPHMLGPYLLRPDHLSELARAAGWRIPLTHYECFLEAFVDDAMLTLIRGQIKLAPLTSGNDKLSHRYSPATSAREWPALYENTVIARCEPILTRCRLTKSLVV